MKLNTLLLSFSLLFVGTTFNSTQNNLLQIKTDKPVFTSTISGQLSGTISLEELSKLKSDITIYKDKTPAEGYDVQSFVVIVVLVKEKEPIVFAQNGSKMEERVFTSLQELVIGDRIILDQVRAKTPDGMRNCAPQVYTITE